MQETNQKGRGGRVIESEAASAQPSSALVDLDYAAGIVGRYERYLSAKHPLFLAAGIVRVADLVHYSRGGNL
jgi:hypothetical protein